MILTVLGSNGTYPTVGRPTSGYLISASTTVLLDCGPGVFPTLVGREPPDVVVLSHRHADHCLDLLPLFNFLRFDRSDVRGIRLLAPAGVSEQLAAFVGAGPDHDFFRVFDSEPVEPGDSVRVGELRLSFGKAVHPVPAVCVSVSDGRHSVTYSGDTGPGGDLVALADGADVLLCEATHQGPPPSDRYPYHLYAAEAGESAAAAKVGQLLVTHVSPTLDPAVSVFEAAAVFDGPVSHAAPGMEVVL